MIPLARSCACTILALAALLAEPHSADGWELTHNLVRRGELELVVADGPLAERCRAAARSLEARTGLELAILSPGAKGDPSRPRIVLGTWETPGIELLTDALGIERREPSGFAYQGKPYTRPGDALVAWFEDPERPGLPVALYFADQLDALTPIIHDFMPPSGPSILCYRGGDVALEASLGAKGQLILRSDFGTWASWSRYRASATTVDDRGVQSLLSAGVDEARCADYRERLLAARDRAADWLALDANALSLRLHFHSQFEDLHELSRGAALAVPNLVAPGAQVLLAPGVPDDGGRAAIYALACRALGPPAEEWVGQGLSVAAANAWWGRPLEAQLGRLASAGIALSPAELVDPASDGAFSPHLLAPLRALLFTLATDFKSERATELWTGARPLDLDAALLERYDARLKAAAAAFRAPEPALDPSNYRAGIALEAERASGIHNGYSRGSYGTRGADRVLETAHAAGANAVVLSTNAFMQDEWPARPDSPRELRREATVSDAALAAAIGKAHSLSMRVLLQPHLLTSPSGILAGRKAWSGEQSFERFQTEYERFIEHYALLSDLLGVEILCFGTELVNAMDFVPDPRRRNVNYALIEAKRERWIEIIERVRGCYDGGLTYAVRSTNAGFSIGQFDLWSHFDFVAAALFESLDRAAWKSENDQARLETQLGAMARKAAEVERPLLVLPIGYPSSLDAAIEPWRPGRESEGVSLERQARIYKALGAALAEARESGELVGAYLWSFSTNPDRSGAMDQGFSPLGKPAEQWLPLVFGQ